MEWSGGSRRGGAGVTVYLNVYDLVSNNWGHSFGFGLYHTGVEIMGQEYSFYGADQADGGGGGIIATVPRTIPPPGKYRESIEMGQIKMSHSELRAVIQTLSKDFTGDQYHIMTRNCNSFSDALCMALIGKHIPGWVNRAATYASPFARFIGPPRTQSAPVLPTTTKAFEGQGHRLSDASSASSSTVATTDVPTYTVKLDDEKPVTSIQLRLHDGSRRQANFNHHHTISEVRKYLDSLSGNQSYDLYTAYPKTLLADPTQTLAEAGLINAVIIQQLK